MTARTVARVARWCRGPRAALTAISAALIVASPGDARDGLGVFQGWAAFRDRPPPHCFAIAEPEGRDVGGRRGPAVAVSNWPASGARGQLHVRLRARKRFGAPVSLAIGDRRFALVAGGGDAWAPNAAADARIVAAMRAGTSMSIETTGRDGRPLVDVYRLRGAASAIDAAALGCLKTAGD